MCDCCGKNHGRENNNGLCAQASGYHHDDGEKLAGPVFTILEPAPKKEPEPGDR